MLEELRTLHQTLLVFVAHYSDHSGLSFICLLSYMHFTLKKHVCLI